jgi:Holliday junction resolvase
MKKDQTGRESEAEITEEMIEAGRAVLRRAFGGETEGANQFVDFPETVRLILEASAECRTSTSSRA